MCFDLRFVISYNFPVDISQFTEDDLYFGQRSSFNSTAADCVVRDLSKDFDLCSKDVKLELFSNGIREVVCSIFYIFSILCDGKSN